MLTKFALAATILTVTAACNHPLICDNDPIAGAYALVTLDGSGVPTTVPATPQMGGATITLQSGTITIAGDQYTVQLTFSSSEGGTTSLADSGRLAVNGDTITFTSANGRQLTATLSGASMAAILTDPTFGVLSMTLIRPEKPPC